MTRIGVTCDQPDPGAAGVPPDLAAALGSLGTVDAIPAAAVLGTHWGAVRPDIVFNAVRGTGEPAPRDRVVAALEALALPFTGSGSDVVQRSRSRALVKVALGSSRVPSAAASIAVGPPDLEQFRRRSFPLTIFPATDAYSAGQGVVVDSAADLEREAGILWSADPAPLFVERHHAGAVFCCVALGNGRDRVVLPPVTLDTVTGPTAGGLPAVGHVPDGLLDDIEAVVRATCDALGFLDLARVDVALSDNGVPHVVVVDPLPQVATDPSNPVSLAAEAAAIHGGELAQRCLIIAALRNGVPLPDAPRLRDVRHRTPPRGLRHRRRSA